MVHISQTNIKHSKHTSVDFGKSKPTSSFTIIKATIIKDLIILTRYKANLLGGIIEIVIFLAMFGIFAFSATFRGSNLDSQGMFIFFMSGLVLIFFTNSALFVPVNKVTNELYNGTLEYLYSNPSSRFAYFVGSIIGDLIIRLIFFIPMYLFLIYYTQIGWIASILILGVTFLIMAVVTSIGVLIALTAITWKQVGSLVGIIQILFQFISGMFIPVSVLPNFVQYIAYLLPFTYGIDLIRYYSFNGEWQALMPIYLEYLILLFYTLFYGLLAIKSLNKVERYAKIKGLHLI